MIIYINNFRGLIMFFEALIRHHTNPSYRINHNGSSNIRTVVFEKYDKRYEYHFLKSSEEDYLLIVSDKASHHELPLIFNTSVLNDLNKELLTVSHDFNFMHVFCFGSESTYQSNTFDDIINSSSLSGRETIEYAGMTIGDDGDSFLATYKLRFNINSGFVSYDSSYHYFEQSNNSDINTNDWDNFKIDFMSIYGSQKIEKKVSELNFLDSSVVQMVNF